MIEKDDEYTLDLFADIPESEDTDMGSDLTAAFESVEGATDDDFGEPAAPEVAQTDTPQAPDATEASADVTPASEPAPDTAKAPQSWGAAEREHWGNLDPAVQAQVKKREAEVQNVMAQASQAKNFQSEFDGSMSRYGQLFQQQNGTPMQAVGEGMQTAAGLMQGTTQSKAETVADLIEQYGIDVATLDTALSGRINRTANPNEPDGNLKNYLSEQLAPMQQFMQQQQNQIQLSQQNQYVSAQQELEQFINNNEFARDLLPDMNDMVGLAGQRGVEMSYQQAYDKALLLRPDIQQIMAQRQGGQAAAQNNQEIQRKQNATVSIPRAGASQANSPEPTDMRGALEAAFGGQ